MKCPNKYYDIKKEIKIIADHLNERLKNEIFKKFNERVKEVWIFKDKRVLYDNIKGKRFVLTNSNKTNTTRPAIYNQSLTAEHLTKASSNFSLEKSLNEILPSINCENRPHDKHFFKQNNNYSNFINLNRTKKPNKLIFPKIQPQKFIVVKEMDNVYQYIISNKEVNK